MPGRHADPETELEVNGAILEYIVHVAIVALLHDAQARGNCSSPPKTGVQPDLALHLVESFLLIFRSKYSEEYGSATMQFRLRLLNFTALFTRRLVHSVTGIEPGVLETLRRRHRARAEAFLSHDCILPGLDLAAIFGTESVTELRLSKQRQRMLEHFTPDAASAFYGSTASLSLLDTLPLFMAVSAAQKALQGNNVTELWMKLAARYMSQAVLEQYLIYGAKDSKVVEEAFAYGFSSHLMADADSDALIIADMFWEGEHEGEVVGWQEIRNEHLLALVPPGGLSLETHFQDLVDGEFSPLQFEDLIIDFLKSMLHAQPAPLLVQFERGTIDGLSVEESKTLREEILGSSR
ncbi:MAG: hypothetical protein Q9187_000232 [Circinaria calcarea]